MISIIVMWVTSLGTFALLDSGLVSLSGAAITDQVIISLDIVGATGCLLRFGNDSVNFGSISPSATISTDGDSVPPPSFWRIMGTRILMFQSNQLTPVRLAEVSLVQE